MIYARTGDLLIACLVAAVFIGLGLYARSKPGPPGPGSTWVDTGITYTPRGVLPPSFYPDPSDPFGGKGSSGGW